MATTAISPVLDETALIPKRLAHSRPLFDPPIVKRASRESFVKLNPVTLAKNPVMLVVEVGAVLTTVFMIRDIYIHASGIAFSLQIALWLWFTVLFANFAEAMAEARGKAQADSLRKTKTDSVARRILAGGAIEVVPASRLRTQDNWSNPVASNGACGGSAPPPPPPSVSQPVPTLSEWGLVMLSGLLALGAVFSLRRRHQ